MLKFQTGDIIKYHDQSYLVHWLVLHASMHRYCVIPLTVSFAVPINHAVLWIETNYILTTDMFREING